ncbi:MAG: twin-arginine translocase TatA/TatE family subunit [Thiovulaceae bacterium]|nr:twin-arginine translocase TatA/TatE family subunit [Sulfurimonadaceae bacterium]
MAIPNGTELLVIAGVVILLFGSKKIPELAKGLGQGIKSFKNELNETSEEQVPKPAQTAASTDTPQHTQTSAEPIKQLNLNSQESHVDTQAKTNQTT